MVSCLWDAGDLGKVTYTILSYWSRFASGIISLLAVLLSLFILITFPFSKFVKIDIF